MSHHLFSLPGRRSSQGVNVRTAALIAVLLGIAGSAIASDPRALLGGPPQEDPRSFTFVVHGDLTGGERPGIFAVAAAQINLLQPDFVINVGDLIEGDGGDADARTVTVEVILQTLAYLNAYPCPPFGEHEVHGHPADHMPEGALRGMLQ